MRDWGGKVIRRIDRPMLLGPPYQFLIVESDTPDLMSYCWLEQGWPQKWISAYHFDKALNYRQPATSSQVMLVSATPVDTTPVNVLVVSGGRGPDGKLFIRPTFVGEASPQLPLSRGQYRIIGLNAQGRELFSLSFDMTEVMDGEEGAATFVFAVPVRLEWANTLARITLSGPEGSAIMDRDSAALAVLLRDSRGKVQGILDDWTDSALTPKDIPQRWVIPVSKAGMSRSAAASRMRPTGTGELPSIVGWRKPFRFRSRSRRLGDITKCTGSPPHGGRKARPQDFPWN